MNYTLYNDDIGLLWFLATLNTDGSTFSSRTRYPIEKFLGAIGAKLDVDITSNDDYMGIVWILGAEQRRALEQVLDSICVILEENKISGVVKAINEISDNRIRQKLLLLYFDLPEFSMGKKVRRYKRLQELLDEIDDDSIVASLLWARFILSLDKVEKIDNRVIRKIAKDVETISVEDRLLRRQYNLEFIHTTHEVARRFDLVSLAKMTSDMPVIKKVRRTSTMSSEAREIVYQRLLPRRGRKASHIPKIFYDLQVDYTYLQLYRLLLIREIVTDVIANLERRGT